MAVSVASVGSLGNTKTGTTFTVGVPPGVASGTLVCAVVMQYASTIPSTIGLTGFTLAKSSASVMNAFGLQFKVWWFYKYATGADTGTYAGTVGTAGQAVMSYAFTLTGWTAASGNPFVDSLHEASTNGGTATVASFTPTANATLLLGMELDGGANIPAAWTQATNQKDLDGDTITLSYDYQAAAAATGSLTFGNADGTVISVASIRQASAASITAAGTLTLAGTASIAGHAAATGTLTLAGTGVLAGHTAAAGGVTLGGVALLGGGLVAAGTVTLSGAVDLGGGITANEGLTLAGTAALGGSVEAADGVDLSGAAELAGGISGVGTITLDGTAELGAALSASGVLELAGAAVLADGTLDAITGTGLLELAGSAQLEAPVSGPAVLTLGGVALITGALPEIPALRTLTAIPVRWTLTGYGEERTLAGTPVTRTLTAKEATG